MHLESDKVLLSRKPSSTHCSLSDALFAISENELKLKQELSFAVAIITYPGTSLTSQQCRNVLHIRVNCRVVFHILVFSHEL